MAREAHIIECADCKSQYETTRPNTKYCGFHRIFRDVTYIRARHKRLSDCPICGEKFAPIEAKQVLCARCAIRVGARKQHPPTACGLCGGVAAPISPYVHICATCVDDPASNHKILELLAAKDRYLRDHPAELGKIEYQGAVGG